MSVAAVKIKIMPSSPEVKIEEIQSKVKSLLESKSAKNPQFQEEPIAFGLKALITMFGWPETQELESLEAALKEIESVSSVEVLDIRRAIG